jgi:hypothetical protein
VEVDLDAATAAAAGPSAAAAAAGPSAAAAAAAGTLTGFWRRQFMKSHTMRSSSSSIVCAKPCTASCTCERRFCLSRRTSPGTFPSTIFRSLFSQPDEVRVVPGGPHAVAAQVALESKGLKPGNHSIASRVETRRLYNLSLITPLRDRHVYKPAFLYI